MKIIQNIEFKAGSKEEKLPGFDPDFPYIASYVDLDKYMGRFAFPAGSGGMVNSNVLHMTKPMPSNENSIQLLHMIVSCYVGDC